MNFLWQLGLLIGFGALLSVSAQIVVKTASSIARDFRIKSFVLALLILGLLTSTPEIFVSVHAITSGVPELAMGTLLGGSILLLSLVIGGSSVILGKISLNHGFTFAEIIVTSGVVVAPIFVLWDGSLSRLEGGILICVYLLQLFFLNSREHVLNHIVKHAGVSKGIGHHSILFFLGMGGMIVSSRFMVHTAEQISSALRITPLIFGLILLSFGTNLPEIALAIESVMLKRRAIAFGDFMGSAAANTLLLGVIGFFSPFVVSDHRRLLVSLVLLGCISLFFVWAISNKRDITRKEGFGLLAFYAIFVAFELFT